MNQEITIAIMTMIIIHFKIVHAIFPRKPRITKITAIIIRRINRLIIIYKRSFQNIDGYPYKDSGIVIPGH